MQLKRQGKTYDRPPARLKSVSKQSSGLTTTMTDAHHSELNAEPETAHRLDGTQVEVSNYGKPSIR